MFNADAEFADQHDEVLPMTRPETPPIGKSRPRIRSSFGSNAGRGSDTDIQQLLTPAASRTSSADAATVTSTLEAVKKVEGESLRSGDSDDGDEDERADMIEAQGGGGGGGISDKAGIILVSAHYDDTESGI